MLKKNINILIGGEAGQGIQTIGSLLAKVCHNTGLFIFSMDDFESRIRGGHNSHLLNISDEFIQAPCETVDILMALDDRTYHQNKDKVNSEGLFLLNSKTQKKNSNTFEIHLEDFAKQAGDVIALNTVAAGLIIAIIGIKLEFFESVLKNQFEAKGQKILDLNIKAGKKGFEEGKKIKFKQIFDFNKSTDEDAKDKLKSFKFNNTIMSGQEAAALGAVAANCRFFPFYPMSPGTGIIASVVPYADKMPIVIEQAEDEIAAICMAVGASFAGVRSMTSTSGGGFCLMTEGLGLAAMTETPVVIVNAQRPGPATGMATRTAQADLLFTINASQDDFPRFVFAPSNPLEVFKTIKKAFWLSEKYQVPSIVLLDHFLADFSQTEPNEFKTGNEYENISCSQTQEKTYLRYQLTDNGISNRQIPCSSSLLVRSTGNEHTQEGFTTEDPDIRNLMVEKRLKKLEMMKEEMHCPLICDKGSDFFLTGWGSSKGSIIEASHILEERGILVGWIIFKDIWPVNAEKLKKILENKKLIMVESNASAQLGQLIQQLTGIKYFDSILKYDGRPIFPEYIINKIKKIMRV